MGFSLVPPKVQFFDSSGHPLDGGKLYTKEVGGGADKATYSDALLTTPNTNPVILNARGEASVFAGAGEVFWLQLKDSDDATIWTADNQAFPNAAFTFPITANEVSAGITPVSLAFPSGDVRRYGVVGNGTANDSTALQNACKGSGAHAWVYIPAHMDCLITSPVVDASLAAYAVGQTWYGGGRIRTANGFNHHVFDLVGITDFTVLRLRGLSGTLGVAVGSATARFFRCTASAHRCKLLYSHITGFQSAAQFLTSEHCRAIGNHLISPLGWGVNVQTDAHYAVVRDNNISDPSGSEHCIYVAGSIGNPVTDTVVDGNTCTGGLGGIKLSYCDDVRVTNNTLYGNTESGLLCGIGTNRANISHNTCYSNGQHGIVLYDQTGTSDRNHVHHNTLRKNDRNGIYVLSATPGAVTNTIISNNDIDDNDQAGGGVYNGISIADALSTGVVIKNNRVTNETTAIKIATGVVGAYLQGNIFAGNTTNILDSGTSTITFNYDKSSYTGTLTGCTTSPTGSIGYSVNGDVVTLVIPAISATSNTTAATVTGMPAAIRPAAAQSVTGITTDNGTTAFGKIIVETSGVLTLHVAQSATFTNSGTKGIAAATVSYRLT